MATTKDQEIAALKERIARLEGEIQGLRFNGYTRYVPPATYYPKPYPTYPSPYITYQTTSGSLSAQANGSSVQAYNLPNVVN